MGYRIIKGAESFYFERGEVGVVLCHGFNATPQSVREIGEMLAARGLTVYAPRLEGHGTHYSDMEACHFTDWVQSVVEAVSVLQKSCRQVYIAGQSMGGTLALYCAAMMKDIDGIVTINAALDVPCYDALKNDARKYIPEGEPDIKASGVHEIVYEMVPVASIRNLLDLAAATREKLKSVQCPVLIIKSATDHIVPPENSDVVYSKVTSPFKWLVTLENSYHVATLDNDKQLLASEIDGFIKSSTLFIAG